MRRSVILLVVASVILAFALAALGLMYAIRLRAWEYLVYDEGIKFGAVQGEDYTTLRWWCHECKLPEQFKLSIRYDNQHFNVQHLSSSTRLVKEGWKKTAIGVDTYILDSPDGVIQCEFTRETLESVHVNAQWLKRAGIETLSVEVGDRAVSLPANSDAIIKGMGPLKARR